MRGAAGPLPRSIAKVRMRRLSTSFWGYMAVPVWAGDTLDSVQWDVLHLKGSWRQVTSNYPLAYPDAFGKRACFVKQQDRHPRRNVDG